MITQVIDDSHYEPHSFLGLVHPLVDRILQNQNDSISEGISDSVSYYVVKNRLDKGVPIDTLRLSIMMTHSDMILFHQQY